MQLLLVSIMNGIDRRLLWLVTALLKKSYRNLFLMDTAGRSWTLWISLCLVKHNPFVKSHFCAACDWMGGK